MIWNIGTPPFRDIPNLSYIVHFEETIFWVSHDKWDQFWSPLFISVLVIKKNYAQDMNGLVSVLPWSWQCHKNICLFSLPCFLQFENIFQNVLRFSTYYAGRRQKSEQNILAIKKGWSEIKVYVDPNLATAFNFKWVLGNALVCKKRGRGIPKVYGFWQPLYTSFSPITHVTFTHFVRHLLNGYC